MQHESDLRIAQRDNTLLVPKHVGWENMCQFRTSLSAINDYDVTPRYTFGELRLSRLNFYAKIFLGRFHYQRVYDQYGSYFSQFSGPLLFVFGTLSLALNALQVDLGAQQLPKGTASMMHTLSQWFSISTLLWLALICSSLFFVFLYMFVDEWQYAIWAKISRGSNIEKL